MLTGQRWQERADLTGELLDDEFPSERDRERVNGYAENRLLRHDAHDDVFPRIQAILDSSTLAQERERWAGLTYVPANVCGLLAKANADDLFLDPPTMTWDGADEVAARWGEVAQRSRLQALALDSVDGASVNGDAFMKVYRGEDGLAYVDEVDPSLVFRGEDYIPEYAALNRDKRTTLFPIIATPVRIPGGELWAVLLEIHEPGRVLYRAYRWEARRQDGADPTFADKGTLSYAVDLEVLGLGDLVDYEEPGLTVPSVVKVPYDRGADAFWGASAYTRGVKALQDSINWQLSTLLSHGERLCAGGIVVLPEEMRATVQARDVTPGGAGKDYGRIALSGGSVPTMTRRMLDVVFEHAQTQGATRYVAEAPQYEGAMKLLEGLWSTFQDVTGLTLDPIFGEDKAPESGRAMRLKRFRDQRRCARLHVRWTDGLQRVAEIALALEGVTDAPLPRVEWCDPVKLTDDEVAEVLTKRTAGKATLSVAGGLERYDRMTPEQAAAEQKRIDEDGKMARVSTPALFSETGQFPDETESPAGAGAVTTPDDAERGRGGAA